MCLGPGHRFLVEPGSEKEEQEKEASSHPWKEFVNSLHTSNMQMRKFKAGEGLTPGGRGDATEVPIQALALLVQEANELG